MSAKKKQQNEPRGPHPLFDIQQAASMTECTGILPAQIETEAEGESVSGLENIFPIHPPRDD